MYEARQNINVYPRTISTVRNRYNRPPQAIQRHVFLNGKVIGIDRAQKEFERMKLELNIKQINIKDQFKSWSFKKPKIMQKEKTIFLIFSVPVESGYNSKYILNNNIYNS